MNATMTMTTMMMMFKLFPPVTSSRSSALPCPTSLPTTSSSPKSGSLSQDIEKRNTAGDEERHILQDLCIQLNLWQRVQTEKYLFIKELKNRCRTKNCELCNDLHSCKFLFPLRLSSQHDCDIFLRYELEKRLRSVNSETYFVNNPY